MTDESSPFYSYDRSSVGWLYPRKEQGLDILNEDLARGEEDRTAILHDHTCLRAELVDEFSRVLIHAVPPTSHKAEAL